MRLLPFAKASIVSIIALALIFCLIRWWRRRNSDEKDQGIDHFVRKFDRKEWQTQGEEALYTSLGQHEPSDDDDVSSLFSLITMISFLPT